MPHDILDMKHVSKLPSSFRTIALAAADGSLEDLSKCALVLGYPDLRTSPSVAWLLPVFYLHLDPKRIPTPDAVDIIVATATRHPCIDAACTALKALGEFVDLSVFPHFVAPDLWRRVWPWMHFIHTYWQHLVGPSFGLDAEIPACMNNCFLVAKLQVDSSARDMTYAQSGLRPLFARVWTAILLDDGVVDKSDIFRQAGRLLPTLADGLHVPANFEEVLDGAGGNLDRLAAAIVKHISLALADRKNKMTVGTLTTAVAFLGAQAATNKEWISALLSQGVITQLVSGLDAFDTSVTADVFETAMGTLDRSIRSKVTSTSAELCFSSVKSCLNTLLSFLTTTPGYPWIAEAVNAGLLHTLISFAMQGSRHDVSIQCIMGQVLAPHLVSRSVITQMKKAVADVRKISGSSRFMKSPIFAVWKDLVELVITRAAILEKWEAAGALTFLACDNVLCGNIQLKNEFKRCAGCCSANYCSGDCQAIDWRDGHREVCDDLRAIRCKYPETVPPRERAFMRALMHHDYQKQLFHIGIREAMFMRDHPGEEYIIVFDYAKSGGPVKFKVDPKRALPGGADLEVELPVQWRRFQRSGGRMGMHIMYVQEGAEGRPRLFPLRASSAEFQQGLLTIARATSFEPDSAEEERHDERTVRALLKKTKGRLTAIH
ncbi:hypothetical protein DFH06DRAFT_1473055 [Mycena polygramma]|nr:hypothetical protein DFH06DRAFT_1473055 [Mycena polygramma]